MGIILDAMLVSIVIPHCLSSSPELRSLKSTCKGLNFVLNPPVSSFSLLLLSSASLSPGEDDGIFSYFTVNNEITIETSVAPDIIPTCQQSTTEDLSLVV